MKTVKLLQRANSFADYLFQGQVGASSSLSDPDQYSNRTSGDVQSQSVLEAQWDGRDRRAVEDRRESERRNEKLSAMLDTRVRSDRRRESRRQTDELELRSFSCRV